LFLKDTFITLLQHPENTDIFVTDCVGVQNSQ
jgi:hypothetical protein